MMARITVLAGEFYDEKTMRAEGWTPVLYSDGEWTRSYDHVSTLKYGGADHCVEVHWEPHMKRQPLNHVRVIVAAVFP